MAAINHAPTAVAVTAERAFLKVLDGSCRTPIAGHAVVSGADIVFRGMLLQPGGCKVYEIRRAGRTIDAARIGADAAAELKSRAEAGF